MVAAAAATAAATAQQKKDIKSATLPTLAVAVSVAAVAAGRTFGGDKKLSRFFAIKKVRQSGRQNPRLWRQETCATAAAAHFS